MNIAKHMEVIFIVAAVLLCAASSVASEHAGAASEPVQMRAPMPAQVLAADEGMATVTVTARRLTAEEKAALPL
jgi:hypothetical protein